MSQTPDTTIIVYSKTGHSRRAAEHLGNQLGVAPFEVTTSRYLWPVFGWIAAVSDALGGKTPQLYQSLELPAKGSVILVGPVWAGQPAAPLNTVLDVLKDGQQAVALLLTCGDKGENASAIPNVEARLGRALRASLVISNRMQDSGDGLTRIADFADACASQASVSV